MRISCRYYLPIFLLVQGCFLSSSFLPLSISNRRIRPAIYSEPITDTVNGAGAATTLEPFIVESSETGPAGATVHRLRFPRLPGQAADVPEVIIETGKIGRQAAGAVTLTRGDSVLYATASRDSKPKEDIDFLPLSVEHQERFSSAGLTSGSYTRRDGRPAEHEILVCRLIDRPIRPLIADGWRHDTQILSWVLSYDGVRTCDPLAIVSAATAVYLSDVPLDKPVAAVQVGLSADGTSFILNPTHVEMEESKLHLTVAGTADAVLMIEGYAEFLPESQMIAAVKFGHEAIQTLCKGIIALGEAVGVKKNYSTIKPLPEGLQEKVNQAFMQKVDEMFASGGRKKDQGDIMSAISTDVAETFAEEFPDKGVAVKKAFKNLLCQRLFARARSSGLRGDGRGLKDIRRIDIEAGFLPRVHGSALFTRGETQAVATATLGDASMRQKIDKIDGTEEKRFYLQYTFPPSSVGETGRVGAPGRREVGHGNLAERALIPVIPSEDDFPYSIRVESLITESHGSSSMASVCGGALALMDAGVPIKRTVAGIAMGMLLGDSDGVSDENAVILSDISGTEDALGTMDFKVAGDREGITTFQLDIKCEGLTLETMERALAQAREGRLHILDEMEKVLSAPRETLPPTVPKILLFDIPFESIGKVIGPGGKQIRAIIEDHELVNMDVADDGKIQVSSMKGEKLEEAKAFVLALVGGNGGMKGDRKDKPKYAGPEPVEGENYTGKITGVHPFGVFVEILPGAEDGSTPGLEGLVHVSEMARERVRNCEGFVRSMGVDELTVKYVGKENGKIRLSRKAVLEEIHGDGQKKQPGPRKPKQAPGAPDMSTQEMDVIAQAIEKITET
ncbi:hypothetical protein ACA910_007757 [Epithemia clementina (nom. ined.)]